ncbi:MAG TPA: patatin-like phospholipase family protein [Verrucomicrobiae bacterium]|nr:patatin-like phospholipase family protein [Verrucomicrobiae bacterium]
MSVPEPPRGFRVAASLPYRRIALVLSGGGALGAYEIGVLRVLETLRLVPSLVVGVSIGAVNAVAWLVAGRDAGPIEHVWRTARGETLGVQWVSLALRIAGTFIAMMALLEAVLTLIGSDEFSGARWFWRHQNPEWDLLSTQLDALCWFGATVFGGLAVFFARRIAAWLDRHANVGPPEKARKRLLVVTCTAAAVHMIVGFMGWPWPHRFSAAVVILLAVVWTASAPGSIGRWSRNLALGLMPETGGRGLWSGRARRRILENLVASGDAGKLVGTGTGLVVSALAVDRGVVTHFVSWPEVDEGFERRIHDELGEVVHLKDATEVISAAMASSAIPGIFQPESVRGREFVDAGGFTNQPLHVAIARDVDAALVVLLSPSQPPAVSSPPDVVALGSRLLELANWRDLQTELRHLPPGWSREGSPARVCVVEPPAPLPTSPLQFDPERAAELIDAGRRDAWAALERAGWIEAVPDALEPAPRAG